MLRRELEYFFGAVRFFTRLPVPAWVGHSSEALNRSARYFPAVGLLIGGIGALVYLGAAQLWPQAVAVLLSMAATIYATGAFHEDGLSDTVDGLGGGWEKLRILEIMKDSRVGSYGVVAMVLALLGKFLLLSSLEPALIPFALLAGHALSRFCATLFGMILAIQPMVAVCLVVVFMLMLFLVMCKFLSILFLYSIHFLFIALSILFQNMLNLCYRNYREELREQEVTSEE